MKRHSATISQEMKDGKGLSLEGFKEKAAELGRAMRKQMMQTLLEGVDEAVKET